MNPDDAPIARPLNGLVPLEAVLCTEELSRRPVRPPDYETHNRALGMLVQALADSPQTILQTLAETILTVLKVESAGVSLLTKDGKRFYWPAIAGMWKPHLGGGTPRDFGPCGDVLDHNRPLLFQHFEWRYAYFELITPPVNECLLVPFYVKGKAVGTIWAITHTDSRLLDAEDLRQLESLGRFASAAHQAVASQDLLSRGGEALRLTQTEVSQRVVELQKMNLEARDARSAAMNLMEDALHARQAMEVLIKESRESAERLRFVAESMPQKVFSASVDGRRTYFGRQWTEYAGVPSELANDWGWTQFLHPDDKEATVRLWKQSMETGESFETHIRFRRRDGAYRWHLSRAVAMRDAAGNIAMWIGSSTDIEEIKRAEQALQEADRRKNEFLAMVSHELRTPLNAIYGWATLLLAGEVPHDKLTSALTTIRRNAQDQVRLIEDLLDVSQIMTGQIKLQTERLDVVDIVESVVESMSPAAESKGVTLERVLHAQTAPISGDRERMEQVLRNLLANAVKFTPNGGRIQVRVEQGESHIGLTVTDTGQGIKPEVLPYIFDRFRQGDSSLTRQHGGLGLGLAIVREIVQLHGGSVSAESPGEGQGTTVRLRLPRMAISSGTVGEQASMLSQSQADGAPSFEYPPVLRGLRVLVVDDDEAALDLLETLYERCGCEVKVAQSGEVGIAEVQAWTPQLIVSDIGMPGMDGYVFIDRVRQYERAYNRLTPAIALTAYVRPEDRIRALSAGYQAHVGKPMDLMELVMVAASLVSAPPPAKAT